MNHWKTKKQYTRAMKPMLRWFYRLYVIRHINYLPKPSTGELQCDDGYYQVMKENDCIAYYKWNWFNPLTWVVNIILLICLLFAHAFMAIADIFASNSVFEVKIPVDY